MLIFPSFIHRMVRIYEKLHKATEQLVFFATRQWQFKSTNIRDLQEQLSEVDQKVLKNFTQKHFKILI